MNNYKLAYRLSRLCQFRHFPIHKRYDSFPLLFFFFILLVDSFPQIVITENDGNCWEDFVQFRHLQDLLFPGFSVFSYLQTAPA